MLRLNNIDEQYPEKNRISKQNLRDNAARYKIHQNDILQSFRNK